MPGAQQSGGERSNFSWHFAPTFMPNGYRCGQDCNHCLVILFDAYEKARGTRTYTTYLWRMTTVIDSKVSLVTQIICEYHLLWFKQRRSSFFIKKNSPLELQAAGTKRFGSCGEPSATPSGIQGNTLAT